MITSVFISNDGIRILTGFAKGKTITVKSNYFAPVDDAILGGVITNDYTLKRKLAEMWNNYSLPKKNVYLIIDSGSILTKTVIVPPAKPDNIIKIIKGEFMDVENYDELLYDYFVLDPKLDNGCASVLACASEKPFLTTYVELFSEIKGLKIECIDVALNCKIKLMRFLNASNKRAVLTAIIDKNVMTTSLFVDGIFKFNSKTRLFEERGTPNLSEEISRAFSSMIQFNKTQKNGYDISDIMICGLTEKEANTPMEISSALGISSVKSFPQYSDIILDKTERPSLRLSVSDCIYCIGNLIRM